MIEENKVDKRKCSGKSKAMITYGIIQIGWKNWSQAM